MSTNMLTLQTNISLKELLKQQNITQTILAKHMKLSRSYVSKLINTPIEELSWKTIQSIIEALNMRCSILIIQ